MIRVDRARVAEPEILRSDRAKKAYADAAAHFSDRKPRAMQTRFRGDRRLQVHPRVKQPLGELFHDKCAYCESRLGKVAPGDVEHFRPANGAVDLSGNFSPEHYWWLSLEWRNIYLACRVCNSTKSNRFPVVGKRARPETPYEKLARERPLLLDPCNDFPGRVLVFDGDGGVASDDERGKITIELLALNRTELAAARREAHASLREQCAAWMEAPAESLRRRILDRLGDSAEYAGLARQFLFEWMRSRKGLSTLWEGRESELETLRAEHEVLTARRRQATARSYKSFESGLENYSLEQDATPGGLHLLDQTVERIQVKNLRAIRDLDIAVASGSQSGGQIGNQGRDQGGASWTLLLGENGTGKSTILQAVALAFAGARYRQSLDVDAASFVRHGCKSGHVRVHVRGFSEPLTLTFRSTGPKARRLTGSDERPKVPVLAYGATRLLPRPGVEPRAGTSYARVDNLFNPFVPLADATRWLMSLGDAQFNHVARSLKDLLGLPPNVVLRRNRRRKQVEIPSLKVASLTQLSDGYQSTLALCADIMMVMTQHFEAMEAARGIVLLDEIGAHLHPRWRMRAVTSLREAFPNIQFLATTHDPLCLRGVGDGEVAVLKRSAKGRVYSLTDLPSITGMRVDQLLTSQHFGLSSTVDPDLEATFERYYELLRVPEPDGEQAEELQGLRGLLASHRVMGATRRERLMLEAIDRHLALEAGDAADAGEDYLEADLADILGPVQRAP